jgi:hypothetical protein
MTFSVVLGAKDVLSLRDEWHVACGMGWRLSGGRPLILASGSAADEIRTGTGGQGIEARKRAGGAPCLVVGHHNSQ